MFVAVIHNKDFTSDIVLAKFNIALEERQEAHWSLIADFLRSDILLILYLVKERSIIGES